MFTIRMEMKKRANVPDVTANTAAKVRMIIITQIRGYPRRGPGQGEGQHEARREEEGEAEVEEGEPAELRRDAAQPLAHPCPGELMSQC